MEQVMWHTVEAANRGLAEIELRISGGKFFDAYLEQLQCDGQAQCTTVWTKTTIAYRCRTCQVNDSSAICVSCFQAGDHRHHDYVMYHSDSGGCCDCGDRAAWKVEGFCNNHSSRLRKKEARIPSHLKDVTSQAVQFVLRELSLWMGIIAEARNAERVPSSYSLEVQMAQTYGVWLQKVCSVTALRTILCQEILCIRTGGTTARCFLDKLLSTYARMPEALMEAETTLFLQMLYDPQFKDSFSRALMRHYGSMILPAVVIPGFLPDFKTLNQSLDRVMVQLFNVPETTLNLIQTDHLLEVVVSVLDSVIRHCINKDAGTVNLNHPAIKQKVYNRPQGDLKLILAHEAVSLHVLKERPDVFKSILSIWSMLQWMNPYTQSETVDFDEQVSWSQAITLEMSTMTTAFGLIGQCFSAFAASGDASRSALVSAACLTMTSLREFFTKVKFSQVSQDTVSLHIPLHRTLCAIISKLVLMPWEESRDGFLSNLQPPFEENEILALMDHPLRVTVWMAQIRAQMWRNSSEDFTRLEQIYRGSIWHAQSMDMDIFMLQFCSVARENMEESVVLTIAKRFDLVDMVTMPTDLGAQNGLLSPKRVSMIHDFLRLMLLIVRERRNTGMSEKESLRSDVIQWLCVRDMTYSQLAYTLSGILVDQVKLNSVLEEVAIYNDPKLQERGFYQLKPECWKEFDPLYAHFYLNDLEEAQERALSVGKLPHYWRLQPPSDAKPPFNRLMRLLHTQACHQLIWNVLHSVTILIRDEVTATSAEALGVMILQILGMALTEMRELASNLHESSMTSESSQMNSASLKPLNNILVFIYTKPSINHRGGTGGYDHMDSSGTYPSIFEMLSHLHKVKESLRLVDMVDHVLQLLSSSSVTNTGFESISPQPLQGSDAYMDDEQRKLKKQRQEAILATFAARQKAFLEKTEDGDDSKEMEGVASPSKDNDIAWPSRGVNDSSLEESSPAGRTGHERDQHECAFCRSECDGKESPIGWIALVQRYNLPSLIHRRGQVLNHVEEVSSLLDTEYEHDGIWFSDMISVVTATSEKDLSSARSVDLHPTEHVRCCGHQMHQACFQRYAESLLKRHYARSPYEGKGLIDLARMDFLCPICRRLANVLLPDVNQVIPWSRLCTKEKQAITRVLPGQANEPDEGLTFFNLNSLLPDASTDLNDVQYWKQYWGTHENLAGAITLFVSQCLRVRNAFLKEPPELEGLPLCQILWETFAENIVHCEVETREGPTVKDVASSSRSSEDSLLWSGDAAHWRALTELGKLALLTNTMPCAAAKHQKRLLVLQWIGFDETITNKFKDDTASSFMDSSQDNEVLRKSDGQQDQENQFKSVYGADDEALPSITEERPNEKSIEQPRFTYAADGRWQETRKDFIGRKIDNLKHRGGDEIAVGWGRGDMFEVGDATNTGWLWNNSKSSSSGAIESSDPFELLIMLLVTFEGWPSFQDVMTMVRVTYVVAATQASVAFDQLNRDRNNGGLSLSGLKDKVMQVACLPFLRRAALLVEIVTENNMQCRKSRQEFLSMDSSFLQRWLNLPSIHDAAKLGLKGKHEMNIQRRCKSNEVVPYLYKTPRQALLTKLPEVFQELVLQNLTVACLNCGRIPREPAICLVCGNLFCLGAECCNIDGMGECYRHADKEGAGLGLYLLMRSTRLVLLRSNRVCTAPSLYLDLHGEEDAYLKRGHPLRLSHLRLNEIKRLWLTAAFDHDTHILHKSHMGAKVL
ncbi:unnamed protein product [Calypogeia fissa]